MYEGGGGGSMDVDTMEVLREKAWNGVPRWVPFWGRLSGYSGVGFWDSFGGRFLDTWLPSKLRFLRVGAPMALFSGPPFRASFWSRLLVLWGPILVPLPRPRFSGSGPTFWRRRRHAKAGG